MSTPRAKTSSGRNGRLGLWRRVSIDEGEAVIRAATVEHPSLVVLGNEHALVLSIDIPGARVTLGRSPGNHLPLTWDPTVSSVHAAIARELDLVTVEDLGPSRNGTFVNDVQVTSRTRLEDRDVVRCGNTEITVRFPTDPGSGSTELLPPRPDWSLLTKRERELVLLLIERWPPERRHLSPPENRVLAAAMGVSFETVRRHLQETYRKLGPFGIENTRTALANAGSRDERALRALGS